MMKADGNQCSHNINTIGTKSNWLTVISGKVLENARWAALKYSWAEIPCVQQTSTIIDITAQGYACREERHEESLRRDSSPAGSLCEESHRQQKSLIASMPGLAFHGPLPWEKNHFSMKKNRLNERQKTPQSSNTQNQWLRIAHVTF